MTPADQVRLIQERVAAECGITPDDIHSTIRREPIPWVRHIAVWIALHEPINIFGREYKEPPHGLIASLFGHKNHGLVRTARKAIHRAMDGDPKTTRELYMLRDRVLTEIRQLKKASACNNQVFNETIEGATR